MFVKYTKLFELPTLKEKINKKRGLLALSELCVANCYCLVFVLVFASDGLQAALDIIGLLFTTLNFRYWHSVKIN
jgi:hypothetical protein